MNYLGHALKWQGNSGTCTTRRKGLLKHLNDGIDMRTGTNGRPSWE